MTNNNNEIMVNQETGEILNAHGLDKQTNGEVIIESTPDYKIVQLPDGSYKKNIRYNQYFSKQAETEEEKIELYQVFNDSDSGLVTPLKNMVDKEINVQHVFMQPYQSFDEKTGVNTEGVTTTIQDIDGNYYATSSKSVYHKLHSIMSTFGFPDDENYKPVKVKVTGTKRQNGIQIDLKLIGLA